MCGIIACLNCENQIKILLEGLNQLQNRGYDSCGISVLSKGEFITQKYASTKDEQALDKLQKNKFTKSNLSIGHTRCNTHGEKNDINAHPHMDCNKNVMLVHNGIITNYLNLKNFLISEGFTFQGETDTEVIANLISYHLEKSDEPFQAFKNAISQLEGSWGLVIILKIDLIVYLFQNQVVLYY